MSKRQILSNLHEEFKRWEELLASLEEAQITRPQLPSNLSVKDVVAHLMAWQQRSIARMEAAVLNREPAFPNWPPGLDPDSEDHLEAINAWIYETHRERPWPSVYQDWKAGFQRFLDLGEAVPENDLLEVGKYPWLKDYPLSLILVASYNHHHEEHREPLLAWLKEHGD